MGYFLWGELCRGGVDEVAAYGELPGYYDVVMGGGCVIGGGVDEAADVGVEVQGGDDYGFLL